MVLCGKEEMNFLFSSEGGPVTWAIRERYGMRGVKMGMGARGASQHQKLGKRKTKREPPATYTQEATLHPTSPTRIAHRMLAAPTGKIAATLSHVYEYSPFHVFLTFILGMRYGKKNNNKRA